jgi:hypothetical protein
VTGEHGDAAVDVAGLPGFASCSYWQYRPWMGIAVRTSLGRPRRFDHPLARLDLLTPRPAMLRMAHDDYRRVYRHQLHRATIERVMVSAAGIRRVARAGDDVPLVLLCFDDLAKPGSWCHRTFAAQWLAEKGHECLELGDVLVAPAT